MKRGLLLGLALLALVGPFGSTADGFSADWHALNSAPWSGAARQVGHWLGTDELGRDVWVRVCLGLRGSLQVAMLALAVAALLGTGLGAMVGRWRGFAAATVARSLDLLAALPLVLLALVLVSFSGRGYAPVAAVLGVLGAVPVARAVRLAVRSASNAEHLRLARIHGEGRWERFRWAWLPAVAGAASTACQVLLPQLLVAEGTLGFIGLSVPDPGVTLGGLLAEGTGRASLAPWLVVAPGSVMFLLLLATRTDPA